MEVLKFTLSGKNAFFKKPEVNTYFYFTYNCIHKVAVLGIFGAILGYRGYNQMLGSDDYPEFYEKLKGLKISVVPKSEDGCFSKKVQRFNNSVGYASKEQGGNLIVKEQWLENPAWDIYVLVTDEETRKLSDAILNKRCIYMPYLGKNDHPAEIKEAVIKEGIKVIEKSGAIQSLAPSKNLELDFDEEEFEISETLFKYEEFLPIALNPKTHLYETERFVYSNMGILGTECEIICVDGKNIVFY